MLEIISWQCECCGKVFDKSNDCLRHETAEMALKLANEYLANGITLQEINETYSLWESIPDNIKHFSGRTTFAVVMWELFNSKIYYISEILPSGKLKVLRKNSTVFTEVVSLSYLSLLISKSWGVAI